MRKLAILGLLLILSIGAFAQDLENHPGGPPTPTPATLAAAKVKFFTILLGLTQAQQDSATTLYTKSETADVAFEATLKTAHTALVTATLANNANGINAASKTIGDTTASMAANDATADAAFNQLLTTEQKTKFAAFLAGDFVVPGPGVGPGHGKGHAN